MPRGALETKSTNVVTGEGAASQSKQTGRAHIAGKPQTKTALNPNGAETETKHEGRIHLAGPSQTKTLVNPNGKDPVEPKPAGKARGHNEFLADQSSAHPPGGPSTSGTTSAAASQRAGKGKTFSPGKNPNKTVERTEPPLFGRGSFADPTNPNSIQQKIIDRPLMFRGTGLHPRSTTPGKAAPRFSRANTNVPLWQGDIATVKPAEKSGAKTTDSGIVVSQRNVAKLKATEKFKPKQVGLFFVKEASIRPSTAGNNKSSAASTAPGQADLFSPEKISIDNTASTRLDGPREVDCLSGSRRGGPPAELKTLTRACLRVGVAVPDDNVSIHRNFGKKVNDKASGSPRSSKELAYHGKKPFPEKVPTSYTARERANEVGSPARAQQEHSPGTILANKRFEHTRRFNSNLHSGLVVNNGAPAQDVAYDHGKKRNEDQKSRKSLQHVFEAPKKDINASYRPTAPWATE